MIVPFSELYESEYPIIPLEPYTGCFPPSLRLGELFPFLKTAKLFKRLSFHSLIPQERHGCHGRRMWGRDAPRVSSSLHAIHLVYSCSCISSSSFRLRPVYFMTCSSGIPSRSNSLATSPLPCCIPSSIPAFLPSLLAVSRAS